MRMIENKNDVCSLDSAMTHIILSGKYYFYSLTLRKEDIHTISGPIEITEGSGIATIILPNDITLHIEDALLSSR